MKGIYGQKLNIKYSISFFHKCVSYKLYNRCFLYTRMGPLYLNTLYLHREGVLSVEATMFVFFTGAQTGQTKHLLSFYDTRRLPQVLSHVWKRRVKWGVTAATWNFTTRCHLNSTHWTFKEIRERIMMKCLILNQERRVKRKEEESVLWVL